MTARTNPHQARVRHLIDSADRSHRAGMSIARDRYIRTARSILDTHRVPHEGAFRDLLAELETTTP